MIKKNDPVCIASAWRDAGDENIEFVALEDESGGRVLIGALGVLHSFVPAQVVAVDMLEPAP